MATKKTTKAIAGLSKKCGCPKRNWALCDHPYTLEFYCSKTAKLYQKAKHKYSLDILAEARGIPVPRDKDAAQAFANLIKSEIQSGTFVVPNAPAPLLPDPTAPLTVDDILQRYRERHVEVPTRREAAKQTMRWHCAVISRTVIPGAGGQKVAFGVKPIAAITKADIEALREARRHAHREALKQRADWETQAATGETPTRKKVRLVPGSANGEVGINRLMERCRHLFAWSVAEGIIERSPFRRDGLAVVKLTRESKRDRRLLDAGEEQRLLAAASPHLRDVLIALLSTGCRVGEILTLQWKNIRTVTTASGHTRQWLVLEKTKTKTATMREVPVGLRLKAILEMRKTGPDGKDFGPDCYVFGNAAGERIGSIKKSWMSCVLKASGHEPQWEKGGRNQLNAVSRAAYRAIDIHVHDLRREAASRLVESGASLVEAQHLLGHSSVAQTATYLSSSLKALETAIERKEKHEQQLADAHQQAETHAVTSAPPVTASVTAPGSDRIQ